MGMFFNSMRKPRGFNHQYIYVNERKEKLEKMEELSLIHISEPTRP